MLARLLAENPIAITGMGVVTSAADSLAGLWQAVCAGISPASWLPFDPPPHRPRYAGCGISQLPAAATDDRLARKLDRSALLAIAATDAALKDAQWTKELLPPHRVGIVAATSRGPVEKWHEANRRLASGRLPPSLAANTPVAGLSGALSLHFHLQGPCFTVSATCASAAAALALGAEQLLLGQADLIVAGGAEAPLQPEVLGPMAAAGLLGHGDDPKTICRPFDKNRNGTVAGEGAGFVILETLASARQRHAPIKAILAGWALGAEARARAAVDQTGEHLARLIQRSLEVAALSPELIGYVNAHGTGTFQNDLAEARALEWVFGPGAQGPACSSTKVVTGHCLGATAALEAIITIEALRQGIAPPSANCREPDPQCRANLVLHHPRTFRPTAALSTSAGLWGNEAALIFKKG